MSSPQARKPFDYYCGPIRSNQPRPRNGTVVPSRQGDHHLIFLGGGSSYSGHWENDQRSGQGRHTYASGAVYDGEWKNDKRDGVGSFYQNDRLVYEGGWKNDSPHGEGTMYGPDGSIYRGDWVEGKRSGHGVLFAAERRPEGADKIRWHDGDTSWGIWYNGEWKDGKFHGQGTLVAPDGTTYHGAFQAGARHGLGRIYWPRTGRHLVGLFDGGQLDTGVVFTMNERDIAVLSELWEFQNPSCWPGARAFLGPRTVSDEILNETLADELKQYTTEMTDASHSLRELASFDLNFQLLSSDRHPSSQWTLAGKPALGAFPAQLPVDDTLTGLSLFPRSPVSTPPEVRVVDSIPDFIERVRVRFGDSTAQEAVEMLDATDQQSRRGRQPVEPPPVPAAVARAPRFPTRRSGSLRSAES